jgi:hypothetical protein
LQKEGVGGAGEAAAVIITAHHHVDVGVRLEGPKRWESRGLERIKPDTRVG